MSSQIIQLKVIRIERETPEAVVIVLQSPENKNLHFIPGQFLTFRLEINGQKVNRSFSICSTVDQLPEIAVAVKEIKDGLVSGYLNRELQPGVMVEVIEPMGNFILQSDPSLKRHIVLFGAGSGITPLYSMLQTILKHEPLSYVSLIYANENEQTVIFGQQLKEIQSKYPETFHYVSIYRKPMGTWEYTGVLNTTMAIHILGSLQVPSGLDTEYYMCGPGGFMDVVKQGLQDLGIPSAKIHKENFSAPVLSPVENKHSEIELKIRTVCVLFNGKEYTFEVNPDESVLFSALDKGIDLPYSCQGGVCTACRGKLKSGKMHLDEREGLSDSELASGYVLTCVGHPLTDDVYIEIG